MLIGASILFPAVLPAQQSHVLPLQLGAPVVGEPLSGARTLDYEPAANSPDPVAYHAEEVFFRDSEGRTRSEFMYPGKLKTIDILDFVTHLHYHWVDGDTVATRHLFPEVPPLAKSSMKLDADAPFVEGIPTHYSHFVTGKDRVEKSVDTWYSPDLSLAMVTIIDQPGIGKTTYRFVHVIRAEPDAALFRLPEGMNVEDPKKTPPPRAVNPPPPPPVDHGASLSENPLPSKPALPHPIEDDNYLEALARFHAAARRWLPSDAYHRHTDVRIVDINGKESSATMDHWQKGILGRDEEQASGWHYTTVWGATQNWSTHEGNSPLRLISLSDLTPRPGPAERRIRIYAPGYVAMKQREIDGVLLKCSGEYAGAELCFFTATGFPALAAVDEERVVYEQWAQYNGVAYPSCLALYRGHRLQMEATTTVTPLDNSNNELFQPLPGITPSSNRFGAYREDNYRVLKWSRMDTNAHGEALVKVFVNESGRVKKAELLDADDKSLGKAAITAAKELVYMPQEINGHRVPFETTFWTSNWSTPDPLRFASTSLKSQGTD